MNAEPKGITFTTPNVRAIVNAMKTQTRRLESDLQPGAVLYVREAYRLPAEFDGRPPTACHPNTLIRYEANGPATPCDHGSLPGPGVLVA